MPQRAARLVDSSGNHVTKGAAHLHEKRWQHGGYGATQPNNHCMPMQRQQRLPHQYAQGRSGSSGIMSSTCGQQQQPGNT